MNRIRINLNPNHTQKLAIDYFKGDILFISEKIRCEIDNDVWENIVDASLHALQDQLGIDGDNDGGYLVLKEKAIEFLSEAGYFVSLESGNIRYLTTNLRENSGQIWSLEKLEEDPGDGYT